MNPAQRPRPTQRQPRAMPVPGGRRPIPRAPLPRQTSGRTRSVGTHGSGQTLVEFALVFPLFIVLVMGIIESAFLFNAELSLNYATRDAALVAAEQGARSEADCYILQKIDEDLKPPTDKSNVVTVHIFSATETGAQLSSPVEQTYTRTGGSAWDCSAAPYTMPYAVGTSSYAPILRCSDVDRSTCVAGTTTGPSNTGVDIIGVQIDYGYRYVTPFGSALSLLQGSGAPMWGGAGFQMTVRNAMRMEPIL